MFTSALETPIGQIVIDADDHSVFSIGFAEILEENPNAITSHAKKQLKQYFAGNHGGFDFPVAQKGTEFQQQVWQQLLNIPMGYPISYTALSKRMNNPLAIRAIASANGKNNLMIVVPCHRVIGANGDLVGYAGGLWRKSGCLNMKPG